MNFVLATLILTGLFALPFAFAILCILNMPMPDPFKPDSQFEGVPPEQKP